MVTMGASVRVRTPQIVHMPSQKMAVVRTVGDPSEVGPAAASALYGTVYRLKAALKKQGRYMQVGSLRARWITADLAPKEQWIGTWALPIPDDTVALPKLDSNVEVSVEVWGYGTVAQVLHIGPFATETASIQRLHEFIAQHGYEVAGPHEEEYLTKPQAKTQKTVIRYAICEPRALGIAADGD